MAAKNNVTVVYHVETGEPRMIIVDAENLADPSWHPGETGSHAHLDVDIDIYNKFERHEEFNNYIIEEILIHREDLMSAKEEVK